jgi:hypothetical protein
LIFKIKKKSENKEGIIKDQMGEEKRTIDHPKPLQWRGLQRQIENI